MSAEFFLQLWRAVMDNRPHSILLIAALLLFVFAVVNECRKDH